MSAPEEIVAETPEAFTRACFQYGAATEWPYLRPGQATEGFKHTPVRIVYRPPPPKPLQSREAVECERRHAFADWVRSAALARCGMLPKEEACGRFGGTGLEIEKLWWSFLDYEAKQEAAAAGRASVKP